MNDITKQLEKAYTLATSQKNYDKALEMCNAVITANPELPDGLRKRAAIYAYMGDLQHAIADISEAIALEPSDASSYFFRGWWYLDNGQAEQAVMDLTTALKLGEEQNFHYHDQSARFFRASALLRLQRYEEALLDCQHVDDDFVIFTESAGKQSKKDLMRQAMMNRPGF